MGAHHARVLAALPDVELVAVADTDAGRAASIASGFGARAYLSHRRMLLEQELDAVTIAVTTQHHCRVGLDCLRAGVHVLMEKPLAATVAEGRRMLHAAER